MDYYKEIIKKGIDEKNARVIYPEIIGNSPALLNFLTKILQSSISDDPVIIHGEPGSGKSLYSELIWKKSARNKFPFVVFDCLSISKELMSCELTGHVKGAFTNAYNNRIGKIESGNKGVLVVENFEYLSKESQGILYNTIESKQVTRLGEIFPREADLKFVFITSKTINEILKNYQIELNFYFKISVFELKTLNLKDLYQDLPKIIKYYCENVIAIPIEKKAIDILLTKTWNGNFQELFSTLRKSRMSASDLITRSDIKNNIKFNTEEVNQQNGFKFNFENFSIDQYMSDLEKSIICQALNKAGGFQSKAARLLGIKERSLWHRIKKFNIAVDKT